MEDAAGADDSVVRGPCIDDLEELFRIGSCSEMGKPVGGGHSERRESVPLEKLERAFEQRRRLGRIGKRCDSGREKMAQAFRPLRAMAKYRAGGGARIAEEGLNRLISQRGLTGHGKRDAAASAMRKNKCGCHKEQAGLFQLPPVLLKMPPAGFGLFTILRDVDLG